MPIPDEIRRHKPTAFGAVELRSINGRYYVYRVTSRWDAERGRARKITLSMIGKITAAHGFIPNQEGMRLLRALQAEAGHQSASGTDAAEQLQVPERLARERNYGAYEVLRQLSPALRGQLRADFPDIFRELEAHALLRLVDGACTSRSFRPAFWASYLYDESPDLACGAAAVCDFITALGLDEARCEQFMRSFCSPGSTVFFDGTAFFSRSQDTLARKGYNPRHRADPKACLLYAFDRSTHRPVFYQVLQGNTVDRTTFMHAVKAAGCTDCLVVADKGFYSRRNLGQLRELGLSRGPHGARGMGLSYILPLQRNSALIPRALLESPSTAAWMGAFVYHGRTIRWHMEQVGELGNSVYVFCDLTHWSEEVTRRLESSDSDAIDEHSSGCMAFITDLSSHSACEIYHLYKERWYIEECFCRLRHKVSPHASYAHTDEFRRGWCFINHVALLYYYGLVNALREKGLSSDYTADDVIRMTRNILAVKQPDGSYELNVVMSETQNILDAMEISLLRKK